MTSPLMITADALWPPASASYVLADGSFAPEWPTSRDNILPGNATPIERAIVDTDGRLDDVDMAFVGRVRDPAQTPVEILPYLAWERSVDVWDPAWPESVQRAVVAAAPIVHRYKGTRYGVQAALDALQVAVHIVEWWETQPEGASYTFKATAYARGRIYGAESAILDPRLIDAIYATIMRTKPKTRAFELAVGVAINSRLGVAAIGVAAAKHRLAVHPPARISGVSRLGAAGVAVAVARHRAAITLSAA